jgi:hypothetical protein
MTTPDPIESPPPAGPPLVPDAPPPLAPPPEPPPAAAGPTDHADPTGQAGPTGPAGPSRPTSPPTAGVPSGPAPAGLVIGLILVVAGAIILVGRLTDFSLGVPAWPLWLIVPGVAMVVGSFAIPPRGGLGLAIPGAILTMVGVVLLFQAATGLYATWAYAWALVAPTGPGLGMLLYGLVRRDGELARDGLKTTLVGLGLFIGFGLFFEGVLGLSGDPLANAREILPVAAIVLGVLLVLASFAGSRRRPTGA